MSERNEKQMTNCRKICLILLAAILGLCITLICFSACSVKEPVVEEETEKIQLSSPQNVKISACTLYWDGVDNAAFYKISAGDYNFTSSDTQYFLDELQTPKNYVIYVIAAGDGNEYTDSKPSKGVSFVVSAPTPGLEYNLLEDGTYEVSMGTISANSVVIPNFYNGKAVSQIASKGFFGYSNLVSVKFPIFLKKIGKGAFSHTCLTAAELPEGLEYIDDYAFSAAGIVGNPGYSSSLKTVKLPASLKYIGEVAFQGALITEIKIPDGVEYIGAYAFAYCQRLNKAVLPPNMTEISGGLFAYCSSLYSVNIPEGVETIGDFAFTDCTHLITLSMPEKLGYVGESAFDNTPWYELWKDSQPEGLLVLKNVIMGYKGQMPENYVIDSLPENVVSIAPVAFRSCRKLKEIKLPEKIKIIGKEVFLGCSSLQKINIPEGVTEIGVSAFEGCVSLTEVNIPEGVTIIGMRAFVGCLSLKEIDLPDSLTEIGLGAFQSCKSITEIKIPENVKKIYAETFNNCSSLTYVYLPGSIVEVGRNAFGLCSGLTQIVLNKNVIDISLAFDNPLFVGGYISPTLYIEEQSVINKINKSVPYIKNCVLSADKSYVVSFTKTEEGVCIPEGITINGPYRKGYAFGGWTTVEGGTEAEYTTETVAQASDNVVLYAIWVQN